MMVMEVTGELKAMVAGFDTVSCARVDCPGSWNCEVPPYFHFSPLDKGLDVITNANCPG